MALARRFAAKWIISSTGEAHFGRDERFTDGALIESVRALLPDLEKYDLRLALEVHGDYGTGESLLNIVRTVDSDRVGINYDTANALYYGGRLPGEDIKTCLPRVNYVHLKDKIGGKGVWNFPAVGSGELDLPGFMRYAREGGYGGPFSIEIEHTERFTMNPKQPSDLKVADEAVLRSYEYLHARGLV
jgi:sugar phosphate isomerase/epimerase